MSPTPKLAERKQEGNINGERKIKERRKGGEARILSQVALQEGQHLFGIPILYLIR